MKTNSKTMMALGLAAATFAGPLGAQVYELTEQTWDNPEFRQRFAESYLGQSEVNPRITPEEKALFDEIVPLISSDPRQAIARLQDEVTPESSAAFDFILGNLLYQEGQAEDSVEAYGRAARKFPNYYRAYYNAGRAYVAMGVYEEALKNLQKALEIQSGDGALYGLIGYCYINTDRPATALDAYRMAVMLAPQSRDWKLGKLQAHIALGQREEAIGLLYEFIDAEPENADWWKLQANQFVAQDEIGKAAANLSVVADMGEADGPTLTLLGDLLLNEGLVQPAMASYAQALDKKHVKTRRIFEVVDSLIALQELEEAETLLAKVEETVKDRFSDAEELTYLNIKARLAVEEDDKEGAERYLEQVVSRDPMNGNALLTLADLARAQGDLAKAKFYAESASKLDDFAHQACLFLAQVNVSQRDYREAAKYLRRAQQISPQDYVADYLLKVEQAAVRM